MFRISPPASFLIFEGRYSPITFDARLVVEFIVAGGDRGMRGEYAPRSYLLLVSSKVLEHGESEENRVPFVHVIGGDFRLQALERQISADSQNRFLRYPGMLVSTVEILGYEPVFGRVSRKIGVEKIDRDASRSGLVMHPNHVMLPDAHLHVSAFDPYGYLERKRLHERARVEVRVQSLPAAQKGLYSG